jgi:hypothetical protein
MRYKLIFSKDASALTQGGPGLGVRGGGGDGHCKRSDLPGRRFLLVLRTEAVTLSWGNEYKTNSEGNSNWVEIVDRRDVLSDALYTVGHPGRTLRGHWVVLARKCF